MPEKGQDGGRQPGQAAFGTGAGGTLSRAQAGPD